MPSPAHRPRRAIRPLPALIFMSRWLQVPLYLGLIVAQAVYVVLFVKELWHLVSASFGLGGGAHDAPITETTVMLSVLGLIDVVMISNLLIMVIIGGYETFVSRLGIEGHPDEPEWLDHVNAGVLKVKLAMAIISISSIHLLKTFINPDQYSLHVVITQVGIHVAFIVSAIAMAWVDCLTTHTHPEHYQDLAARHPSADAAGAAHDAAHAAHAAAHATPSAQAAAQAPVQHSKP